ncbi:hypothetical protein JAAARDRAFT_682625 [Jaapia argillacea MUCL 33604]|uniref:Uncharacterized protein n=1 Tax=Jaapia argillacea MUCL 33604 TaxID=933084 RepID=A0A067QA04_9AGAM|nr:hypothetical protein JAAARDRAFT_682625 [Jaapia argillacea MUCL 33604]
MSLLKLNVPRLGVFTSFNMDEGPEYGSPGFTLALPDVIDDVGDLVNARVHSNVYPMLPFLFKRPLRHGVIFERLNYRFETFPIVYECGSWRLEASVREQWDVLEQVLTSLATISLLHGSLRCFLVKSCATPAPRSKRYLDGFSSSRSARVACMNSLHAFDLLIASCSFGIATCSTTNWREELAVYHPTYSDLLCVSPINSFNPGSRVGVIINVSCCDWMDWVPNLVSRNVPVWLWWGTPEWPLSPPQPRQKWPLWLDNAAPNDEDRCRFLFGNPLSIYHPLSAPPTPSHPSTPSHPGTSFHLSDQHRPIPHDTSAPFEGESFVDFFARRKRTTELAVQSGGQKSQSIISRREHSLRLQCPGNTGARVFQWFFDDQGSPVRVPVPQNSVASTWDSYSDSQRNYDPLNNHWDLCLYLDPTALSPLHAASYDITHEESIVGRDDPIHEPPPEVYPIQSPPRVAPPSQDRLDRDVQRMQERRSDTTDGPLTLDLVFEPLETIAYLRYGWCVAEKHIQDQPPYSLTELQTLLSHNLRRIALEGLVDPTPSAVVEMSPFFRHLSKLPTPPSQSDLSQNSRSQISLPGTFSITPVQVKGLTGSRTNRAVLYMVRFHRGDMPWRVAFDSASSLLHCIRSSHCTSSERLVTYCVERGIEFRTVVCFPPQVLRPPPYRGFRYDGLGWRPKSYRPTLQDYSVYESIRDGFLLRQAHSRAALMKGGIIWRLAIHALGKDHVLQGPSHHIMVMGVGLLDRRLGSSFWDDDLSEGEMMLISGCYYVETCCKSTPFVALWNAIPIWCTKPEIRKVNYRGGQSTTSGRRGPLTQGIGHQPLRAGFSTDLVKYETAKLL